MCGLFTDEIPQIYTFILKKKKERSGSSGLVWDVKLASLLSLNLIETQYCYICLEFSLLSSP